MRKSRGVSVYVVPVMFMVPPVVVPTMHPWVYGVHLHLMPHYAWLHHHAVHCILLLLWVAVHSRGRGRLVQCLWTHVRRVPHVGTAPHLRWHHHIVLRRLPLPMHIGVEAVNKKHWCVSHGL